jgi:hypothetical protein
MPAMMEVLKNSYAGIKKPASRSKEQTAISGKPINAVGSSLRTCSSKQMPKPSDLALPAQS